MNFKLSDLINSLVALNYGQGVRFVQAIITLFLSDEKNFNDKQVTSNHLKKNYKGVF